MKTVETVTVTGMVPDEKSTIDTKSYTLSKDLQATTGSIADALRNVPAVEVDLQGNLSMRGDSNVTILVDGKPSPAFEGKNRADALQQLPADQIERVEVITNPSVALNPEGSGGVINLITKKSRGGGVTGSAYATVGERRAEARGRQSRLQQSDAGGDRGALRQLPAQQGPHHRPPRGASIRQRPGGEQCRPEHRPQPQPRAERAGQRRPGRRPTRTR